MSIILVSHDLGVVAGRTDRVFVMYGGKVMEQAPTSSLANEMWHPYSRALAGSAAAPQRRRRRPAAGNCRTTA